MTRTSTLLLPFQTKPKLFLNGGDYLGSGRTTCRGSLLRRRKPGICEHQPQNIEPFKPGLIDNRALPDLARIRLTVFGLRLEIVWFPIDPVRDTMNGEANMSYAHPITSRK